MENLQECFLVDQGSFDSQLLSRVSLSPHNLRPFSKQLTDSEMWVRSTLCIGCVCVCSHSQGFKTLPFRQSEPPQPAFCLFWLHPFFFFPCSPGWPGTCYVAKDDCIPLILLPPDLCHSGSFNRLLGLPVPNHFLERGLSLSSQLISCGSIVLAPDGAFRTTDFFLGLHTLEPGRVILDAREECT